MNSASEPWIHELQSLALHRAQEHFLLEQRRRATMKRLALRVAMLTLATLALFASIFYMGLFTPREAAARYLEATEVSHVTLPAPTPSEISNDPPRPDNASPLAMVAATEPSITRTFPREELTVTPTPDAPVAPPPTPTEPATTTTSTPDEPSSASQVRVTGTGGRGLVLRQAPGLTAQAVSLLPEGTVLQSVGEQEQADGYLWIKVTNMEGVTGWVAGAWLRSVA